MTSVPTSPEGIDVAWLNSVIGDTASPFVSVAVEPMAADTGMYGRLARVTARGADATHAPAIFVAKFASASAETRAAVGKSGLYRNEYDFYTRMAEGFPIRVPRCHFAHYDPTNYDTLLLLEALDGTFGDDVLGATLNQARTAVDTVARMHRYWTDSHRLDAHPWVPRFLDSDFYRGLDAIDADYVRRAMVVLDDLVPGWLRRHAPQTATILKSQLAELCQLPSTLLHSDIRLANMCFDDSGGAMSLIDWQFPFRGPGIWDLSILVCYGLTVADRRAWQQDLFERYFDGGQIPDWVHAAYRRAALFMVFNMVRNAVLLDLTNAGAQALMKVFVERSCAAVEDAGALDLLA